MSNENSLNRNVAGSNKTGNLGNLAVGALFGRSIRGRSGRGGGATERSAEDWNNQDLLEQRQHERAKELSTHNTALGAVTREHTAQTEVGALKDIHSYFNDNGYDLGNVRHGSTNVTLKRPPQKKGAASTDSQGTSGVQKGQQFNKPMPAFSVAGPGGKRQKNPEYVAWKGERDTFNADLTAGNVKPVGLAAKPGKVPTTPKAPKA